MEEYLIYPYCLLYVAVVSYVHMEIRRTMGHGVLVPSSANTSGTPTLKRQKHPGTKHGWADDVQCLRGSHGGVPKYSALRRCISRYCDLAPSRVGSRCLTTASPEGLRRGFLGLVMF